MTRNARRRQVIPLLKFPVQAFNLYHEENEEAEEHTETATQDEGGSCRI
jgi:hypothetical protein